MSTTSYKPQPRELLPEWMIGMTDRIMDFYTKRYLHCDPVILKNPPPPQDGHKYLLYAHIPFCHTLCSYCTFHRFLFKEHVARAYFVNLRKEMDYVKALGYDFHSMYVGGGTTTIIEEELIKTLEHARKLFPSIKEISCETDPQIITTPQFRNLKGLVDRMSIGVQSFNDDLLKLSERYEKFGSGEQIFERLQYAQELFPTCNIDMMFGFRGQTLDMLHEDMEKIWKLNPRQVTTYPLMVTSQTRKSVKNVIAALTEGFAEIEPDVTISYDPTGSGAGITGATDKTLDIGLSSRALKDDEKNDVDGTTVALDGIAIIVNKDSKVADLTVDQLKQMFTGEITNWSEVGGDDGEIVLIGREAGSGTRDGFESIVDVKDSCKYAQELTATGAVISAVEANPLAIGYASLSAVGDTVAMVTVEGVECSEDTVKDGSYKIQRPFVFVTNKSVALSEQAQAFVDFATSKDAADLIRTAGAVPVNE